MEEILNDTISAQELEVCNFIIWFYCKTALTHSLYVFIYAIFIHTSLLIILQKFEKVYMKELQDKKCVSAKTQFEYGW